MNGTTLNSVPLNSPNPMLNWVNQKVDLSDDELLWLGHPPRRFLPKIAFFFDLALQVIFIVGIASVTINLLIAGLLNYDILFVGKFIIPLSGAIGSILGILKMIDYSQNQQHMIYGITKKKVFWLRKNKLNELPFADIAKIHLVGRNDLPDYFTIHFNPRTKIDFWGYNYEKIDSRPFPTFELVKNGDEVYKKMMELWWENR